MFEYISLLNSQPNRVSIENNARERPAAKTDVKSRPVSIWIHNR
jgi:hypothetical protein